MAKNMPQGLKSRIHFGKLFGAAEAAPLQNSADY
jgi:hypothetical protein